QPCRHGDGGYDIHGDWCVSLLKAASFFIPGGHLFEESSMLWQVFVRAALLVANPRARSTLRCASIYARHTRGRFEFPERRPLASRRSAGVREGRNGSEKERA